MTDENEKPEAPPESPPPDKLKEELEKNVNNDPDLLERIFEIRTQTGPEAMSGGEPIPKTECTFIMDHTVCEPGVFPQDFKITLRGLSSGQEISATKDHGNDALEVGIMLAKASLYALNGRPIKESDHRDFLWEAIGSGGRQIVQAMYAQFGMAPASALGKAMASTTIG